MKVNVVNIFLGSKPAIKKLNTMDISHVKINGSDLEQVNCAKVLGVLFDEVLSWQKQVNACICKSMGNFYQMYRFRKFLSEEAKITLCDSILLSQFNYCDIVYSNMDVFLEKKVQKVQNLCLRFIFGYSRKDYYNYDELLKKLGWLNMKQRRVQHGLTMIYKILHDHAPNYLSDTFSLTSEIHDRNTRSANSIWLNKNATSKLHRKYSSFYMAKIYNTL